MRRLLPCLLLLVACDEQTPTADPTPTVTVSAAPPPSATAPPPAPSAPPIEYEREDLPEPDLVAETLEAQRAAMLRRMTALGVLPPGKVDEVKAIVDASNWLGQGNPEIVDHPMTRTECLERRAKAEVKHEVEPRCGAPYMAPIYDPETQSTEDAKVCVDRYEFPGLPCEYPVTWVKTSEAQKLCQALGKRLCDAHEWEGGCAGKLIEAEKEYRFGSERPIMRGLHNVNREVRWAYGEEKDHGRCASNSHRGKKCSSSGWGKCGSNTYPAGAFPECRSPFGIYDQHGNAAEHMLLPMTEKDLGARGGTGVAEMKGSWFIFNKVEAHIDDCRWRAPSWHDNEGLNHRNYHLGFRCCKDVGD